MNDIVQHLRSRIVPLTIIFISYFVFAQISVYLYRVVGTNPSVILVPAGIAFAAVIYEGYAALIPIALAAAINATLSLGLGSVSIVIVLFSTLGNTLQPAVALFIFRYFGFDRMFFRLKDMFTLIFVALFVTMIVPTSSFLGSTVANLYFGAHRPTAWLSWWLGAALSALVLTPVLIRWIESPVVARSMKRYIEITAALAVLGTSTYFVFFTLNTTLFGFSLVYFQIAALFWLVFRGGARFTTLGLLGMTAISLVGAVYGVHANPKPVDETIFNTQIYDLFLTVFFFILMSLEEQRTIAQRSLGEYAQKLEDALANISSQDVAKNEFIALLGHELRNPLASLLSAVELMKIAEPSEAERKDILETMNDRIRSMAHLLDDILDISRITARKFTLNTETVNLREVALRAVAAVAPLMRKQSHEFTVAVSDTTIELDADPTRLEQIMVNLLHNAAKYTPPGGRIDFSGDYADGMVTVRVRDTGIGIVPEMQQRIFEPFVQINAKNQRAGGIGIGLSLTKSLVELHGGTIEVVSGGEGRGSEFTVRLPGRQQTSLPEKSTPKAQAADHKVPPLNILVVDDNEEAAHGIAQLLKLRGHTVSLGYDGEQAVGEALSSKPDIAILDIGLPDIDGYEVAGRLRKANVSSVLIALSGYGQAEDKRKAVEAGFDYHLTKPVGLAELEPLIAKITRSAA